MTEIPSFIVCMERPNQPQLAVAVCETNKCGLLGGCAEYREYLEKVAAAQKDDITVDPLTGEVLEIDPLTGEQIPFDPLA